MINKLDQQTIFRKFDSHWILLTFDQIMISLVYDSSITLSVMISLVVLYALHNSSINIFLLLFPIKISDQVICLNFSLLKLILVCVDTIAMNGYIQVVADIIIFL